MKFCDRCGSYLRRTPEGLWCQKCRMLFPLDSNEELRNVDKEASDIVYVVERSTDKGSRVAWSCPKCGNEEADHWFSPISGEHAGIRRERTIEHYKCTKCSYSTSKSS
jgi:DNA-directed RNA polymerase subunit M/transcription elongation factor TFIIS